MERSTSPPRGSELFARAGRLALVACAAVLLQFHARQIVTASVLYDDAFIASVAKNVALGLGYGTSYNGFDLFDPEISTGPVIVLPAALMMRALGNAYWVPNLAITLAIWLSLGLLLWRFRRDVPGLPRAVPGITVLVGIIFFATNEFGLLGDLPAALLVGVSFAMYAGAPPAGRARGVMAGAMFGAAIYAKLTVALALPAIAAITLHDVLSSHRVSAGRAAPFKRTGWFLAGLLLPACLWQVYQLSAVSWSASAWMAVKAREVAFLAGSQSLSGIGHLRGAASWLGQVSANVPGNLGALSSYFGSLWVLLPGLAGLAVAATARGRSSSVNRMASLLGCAVVFHLAWWLVVSPTGWYRHLLPGIVYAIMLAAVLLGAAAAISPRRALAGAAGCLLSIALLLPAWYPQAGDFARVFTPDVSREPRLEALLKTRDTVDTLSRDPSVLLMGCGWWVARDLEYVLPASNNFRDCFRLTPADTSGKRLLLVRNEIFNRPVHEPLARYQRNCDRAVVYRREPFVISECSGLPTPDPDRP